MIAIGIDPGTRNLGWGVVRSAGNRLVHVEHGVIRTKADSSLSSRLLTIGDALDEVIARFKPGIASVEGMFFEKNAQSAAKLGHARGVVLLCLERQGVPVHEHAPARVKRTLTGKGRAEKSQVARMVMAILSLEETPPLDASDALAMAITALRIDPRAHVFQEKQLKARRKKMPAHFAEALRRTRALGS
jgi:crossover junction endodeoxyribonuclease RuvC